MDLVKRPPVDLAWPDDDEQLDDRPLLVTRVRQATARGLVTVADQPAVIRARAVTRQAPRAGVRLVIWTPRGAKRGVEWSREWLFGTRSAAMVARLADTDHPDWHKAAAELGKLHARLATRRWVVGCVAGAALLAVLAWQAPRVFAGLLAVAVAVGALALARPVCRDPKELAGCVIVALGLGWVAWALGPDLATKVPRPPEWAWWTLGVVGVVGLGLLGRKDDQHLVEMPARMAAHQPPPVTAPMIVEALFRIGVAGMTTTAADKGMRDEIRVRAPGVGRALNGWQIELELPPGITAGDVGEKREELAGALRRPLGCVWPSGGGDHPGHLRIYIGDKPMSTAPQTPWPLADGHRIDIFDPFPLFTDEEGRWIDVTLDSHVVIAGASGYGKSVTGRQLACAVALDPRVKVILFDGKISGDFAAAQKICHRYHEGVEPEDIAEQAATLDWLERECRRRSRFLRDLPAEERSPKVTSALASRYPKDLAPIVVILDEVQEYTEFGDKQVKAEKDVRDRFRGRLSTCSRISRSAGMRFVFITQKPDDTVLPSAIVSNCAIRICHKVTGQVHNDQVLGTGSYKGGVNAALFSQNERGLAWLRAVGDPRVVRSWSEMTDLDVAEELFGKAYAMRKALHLLTGQAADEQADEPEVVYDLVVDAEYVMGARGAGKAQWGELAGWLRELRAQWAELTEDEVSVGVRTALGTSPRDVRSGGRVRKGVYISDLRKHLAEDGTD